MWTDEDVIYRAFTELLEVEEVYRSMSGAVNPYCDGNSCESIADVLKGKEVVEWKG